MLEHGRSRFLAHAPIGQHLPPRGSVTSLGKAGSDRAACLYPSATVRICNPRMSTPARQDEASAWRHLSQQPCKGLSALGLDQRVVIQRSSWRDVLWSWHDVVVTGQYYGCAARHEFRGVGNEALKPSQLVIEFRSRLRIPVGKVDGAILAERPTNSDDRGTHASQGRQYRKSVRRMPHACD